MGHRHPDPTCSMATGLTTPVARRKEGGMRRPEAASRGPDRACKARWQE